MQGALPLEKKDKFMFENTTAIILAAGQGSRMQSDMAKVLHEVNGKPMLYYVMESAYRVVGENLVIVVGYQHRAVKETAKAIGPARFALQHRQNGTGDAVMCGMAALPERTQRVLILCGDVPLISAATLTAFVGDHLAESAQISVLGVKQDNPFGYGRIVCDEEGPLGIVEEADADAEQKKINIVNSGIYCIETGLLYQALPMIDNNNAQGEVYLTDIIAISRGLGCRGNLFLGENSEEVLGVNTVEELNRVAAILAVR